MSNLQALKSYRTKRLLSISIEQNLLTLKYRAWIGHISTHKGIFDNEVAVILAKEVTRKRKMHHYLPLPSSYIKCYLKTNTLKDWQIHCTTSTKGRHTYTLIPKVSYTLFHLIYHTTAFFYWSWPLSPILLLIPLYFFKPMRKWWTKYSVTSIFNDTLIRQ